MDWITTSTILKHLQAEPHGAAWAQLMERFRAPIMTFARRIGVSPSDAEDVAQETLLAFANAFRDGQFDPQKGRLSRWLFGIAYRQALSMRRKEGRRVDRAAGGPEAFEDPADERSASATWDREWEEALLRQCLEQVRQEVEPTTFEAFQATVRDGRKPADVATALGVPIKTIYNARHRVLNRIRELRLALESLE